MLIGLWHRRPILWDSATPEYLDTSKKHAALKEISLAMNIDVQTLSKQMKSLKSYYCSLRAGHEQTSKGQTNGDAAVVKKPTWPYYSMLKFLDENINRNSNGSSMKRSDKGGEDQSASSAKSARRAKHSHESDSSSSTGSPAKEEGNVLDGSGVSNAGPVGEFLSLFYGT